MTGLAEHCWRIIFSSALRYERGRSDSASFAARPRRALHASRSASRRCQGSARSASNRAAGTPVPDAALGTVAALRHAQLRIQRRPPDSVERAALSMLRTQAAIGAPWPFGHAGGVAVSVVFAMSSMLDIISIIS